MSGPHRLQRDALGLPHAIAMGVAGTAPSFSIAASASVLIVTAGSLAPAIVLYCGLVILGIVIAFQRLNHGAPNAGASFLWVTQTFGPTLGFLAGWSMLATSVLFMASATLPAASATLLLVAPTLEGNRSVLALVSLGWLVAIGLATLRSTRLAGQMQGAMIAIELTGLGVIGVAALLHFGADALRQFDWAWFSLAGASAEQIVNGALIALFLFWGWDISLNLAEETSNGGHTSGLGAVLAMLILILLFMAFHAVALTVLNETQIRDAGPHLILHVADQLFPRPWSLIAVVVVMLSTVGALATTTLGFSRTLFAQSRHGVMHPRWQRIHPRWNTPHLATLLIAALGAALLLLSLTVDDIAEVLRIAITAIGLQAAFYYGLTGYACAWTHRRGSRGSVLQYLLLVVWPALAATALWIAAALLIRDFDALTTLIGVGTIAVGLVPLTLNRRTSRHRRTR